MSDKERKFFLEVEAETWGFESADDRDKGDYEKIGNEGFDDDFEDKDDAIKAFCTLAKFHENCVSEIARSGSDHRDWVRCEEKGKIPIEICFHTRLYDENEDLLLSSSVSVYRNKRE